MNIFHYAKFLLIHLVGLTALLAILAGGHWMVLGLVTVMAFYIGGDAICGDDTTTPHFIHPGVLTCMLWLALPLLMMIVGAFIWSVSPADVGNLGASLSHYIGYDLVAAKQATTAWQHGAGVVLVGLMIGTIGTVTGHELTHRTWDPMSMLIGRWMLAFSFDAAFSIEHVYGHHRYVATAQDPATAPRGRNVYWHIVASTLNGNISAWQIERRRLKRKGLGLFSLHNAVLRGYAMSLVVLAGAYAIGGMVAVSYLILCGLLGKALLEVVNYMEHYGMVRDPATPVQPRHSWNTNKRITSWAMFNLSRHSHHHAQGEVPYHDLKPFPHAPMMIGGYLTTLVIALIPPLWHTLMTPKVLDWDKSFATQEERKLAMTANQRSGIDSLRAANALPHYHP
ncbi:alkane 1-monooxygenase [Aestuariibacter halophilus]|uniref:Alkane 1-monooxygenase n=1 Tax=Fluctibacter halophilus TaxID=226011 RepID=A0ABS8GCT8_9ALTE|nr:alkane 1-monooxygenase [Aestuariibacter halophilus]MCC2618198.1 alkane 1-monooxygenase [Aestuariibacter halophilus]